MHSEESKHAHAHAHARARTQTPGRLGRPEGPTAPTMTSTSIKGGPAAMAVAGDGTRDPMSCKCRAHRTCIFIGMGARVFKGACFGLVVSPS